MSSLKLYLENHDAHGRPRSRHLRGGSVGPGICPDIKNEKMMATNS
jgi:hypothetical protein